MTFKSVHSCFPGGSDSAQVHTIVLSYLGFRLLMSFPVGNRILSAFVTMPLRFTNGMVNLEFAALQSAKGE